MATPVTPLPPAVGRPMYQGSQRYFTSSTGGTCLGRVAASMATAAFCYLAADDAVKCAGMVAGTNYGMTFSPVGVTGAEQIMLMFLDNGLCITRTDHTVVCMDSNTNAFGPGSRTTFTRWTARDDLAAIATGTWDQICGITTAGQVYCGGLGNPNFGNPPIAVGPPGQSSVWVSTSGQARLSDTAVLRAGESRTECQVRANGLGCAGANYGPTDGSVVSGTPISLPGGDAPCWLTSAGTVTCTNGPRFAPGKVLFLAGSFYSDSLCAIYNDGSVWCIGSNANGKLGTGNTAPLATETMVAPPGSARVRCE